MKPGSIFLSFIIMASLLSACSLGGSQVTTEPPPVGESSALPDGANPSPREVVFQASDGQVLNGLYYPAAADPAPVVVLMHWENGDRSDWYEIAPWLQNRALDNPLPVPADFDMWDPSWFPPVPPDNSYGVFIFSFRGCAPAMQGCAIWTPEVWLLDAQAAMLTATTLEGADPGRIAAIGSSIGADGAADACAWLNTQPNGTCRGALSLSPGEYMNIPYAQAVRDLGQADPPATAWCLADRAEIAICNRAAGSGNPAFRAVEIPGAGHGTMLLSRELEPLPMQLILDFLDEAIGQ